MKHLTIDTSQRHTAIRWRVNWDNGNDACGTFPDVYETEDAAQRAGDDWASESNARDGIDPDSEQGYTAEAIAVEMSVTDEELPR